jgi:hypothetical protein
VQSIHNDNEQDEREECDPGFAGQSNVWAKMNATAHATGDHLRAWIEAFTTSSSSSVSSTSNMWTV